MTLRSALTAAGFAIMTVAAGYAAAGSTIENVKVPFAFRAGLAAMPAGNYQLTVESYRAVPMIRVRNVDTNQNAVVLAMTALTPDTNLRGNQANIVFLCAGSDCVFSEIQPGRGVNGYRMSAPKFRDQLGVDRTVPSHEVARMVIPSVRAD